MFPTPPAPRPRQPGKCDISFTSTFDRRNCISRVEIQYKCRQGMGRAAFLSAGSGWDPFPCLFQLLRLPPFSGWLSLSSVFRASNGRPGPSHAAFHAYLVITLGPPEESPYLKG